MAKDETPEEQREEAEKAKVKAAEDRAKAKADREAAEAAVLRQAEIDQQNGYRKRALANGTTDFVALHDQWSNPDEAQVQEHVTAYRNRLTGVTQ